MTDHVLCVLTSHSADGKFGWYLPELVHPYNVFKRAGLKITICSIKGGDTPLDQASVEGFKDDKECMDFHKDEACMALTNNTKKLSDISLDDVDAIFFVGGHGTMWDFRDECVQKAILTMWEAGKIVSAVCHAPIAFVDVKLADGTYLVKDKTVAGFTNSEEDAAGTTAAMPSLLETDLIDRGAKYVKGDDWSVKVAVDGKLISGQNPQSATGVGEAIVKELNAGAASKHVLCVLTSSSGDGKFGWYLPELVHPYTIFKKNDCKITICSIKGGETPLDKSSVEAMKDDKECTDFLADEAAMKLTNETKPLSDIDLGDVDAIFLVGGHGTMFDFRDECVQKAINTLWEAGKVVSAVCHAPIGFVDVKLADGTYLVKDKHVVGFTNSEEDACGTTAAMPSLLENDLQERGAKYTKAADWAVHTAVDGKLISGQNPQSAGAVGWHIVRAIR